MNCPLCKKPLVTENTELKCHSCEFSISTATKESDFRIDWEHGILKKYLGTAPQVIIPPGIKEIGNHVFMDKKSLIQVVFPRSLHKIGKEAFQNCANLQSVTFPETLSAIRQSAFRDCVALTTVEIPEHVRSVATSTFQGCTQLKSLTIHGGKAKLWKWAFADCVNLTEVNISDIPLEKVDPTAFDNTPYQQELIKQLEKERENDPDMETPVPFSSQLVSSLSGFFPEPPVVTVDENLPPPEPTVLKVPEGTKELDPNAYAGDETITEVILPDTLEVIGEKAFYQCTNLKKVVLPPHLKVMEKQCFSETALEEVRIPATVKTLGYGMFQKCSKLKEVFLPHFITALPDRAFSLCTSLESIDLKRVTTVGAGAFTRCDKLREVKGEMVTFLGVSAFELCSALKTIDFPVVEEISGLCFKKCTSLTEVSLSETCVCLGNLAFADCRKLVKVEMKNPCVAYGNMPFVHTGYGKSFLKDIPPSEDALVDTCFYYRRLSERNRLKYLETWQNLEHLLTYLLKTVDMTSPEAGAKQCMELSLQYFTLYPESDKLEPFSQILQDLLQGFGSVYAKLGESVETDLERFVVWTYYFCLTTMPVKKHLLLYLCNHFSFVSVSDKVKKLEIPEKSSSEEVLVALDSMEQSLVLPSVSTKKELSPHEIVVRKYTEAFYATEEEAKKSPVESTEAKINEETSEEPTETSTSEEIVPETHALTVAVSEEILEEVLKESPLEDFEIVNGKLISYEGDEDLVVIPTSIVLIGTQAFSKSNVERVVISESVAFIDTRAFMNCRYLEKVSLPMSLIEVKELAFAGCKSLSKVDIANEDTIIDKKAFQDTPWGKKHGYHKKIF